MKKILTVLFLLLILTAQTAQGANMRLTAVVVGTRNPTAEETNKSILIMQVSGAGGLFDQREVVVDEALQSSQKNAALKAAAVSIAKESFPATWANASSNDVDLFGQAQ